MIPIVALIILMASAGADAGGPFGPPQPIVKGTGGKHTGIGYWYQQENYRKDTDLLVRQNQIYSELGYGSQNRWEAYARIGVSDLKGIDAFRSQAAATSATQSDLREDWKFFGTLGLKGFYPINGTFGVGAFIQGSYSFSDFTDRVYGVSGGAAYELEMRVKNLWDINAGIGFQATLPFGAKIYAGPFVRYAEAKVWPSMKVAGLALTDAETTMTNQNRFGGFSGIEIPLGKGFRLDVEGQYSAKLSAGASVVYTY